MRFIFKISIYILTCLLFMGLNKEIKSQDFPCGSNAASNFNIPDNNNNVYLSENSVAIDPNHPNIILCANNLNNSSSHNQVAAFISTNWGANWSGQNNGVFDQNSLSDPSAAINLNGRLYVSYVDVNTNLKIAFSDNLGSSWSTYTISNNGSDKDYLCVDNSCNSPYKGRIYCAWTNNYTNIEISYSDNGINWSSPQTISYTSQLQTGVNIVTDNAGNVYAGWVIYDADGFWNIIFFNKSTNGGVNWGNSIIFTNTYQNYLANIGANGCGPSMAANMQDNTLFLVYSANTQIKNVYSEVYLKKSTNGGINWSDAGTVNQVSMGDQTFPWLSCDPILGYLACIYYVTRNTGLRAYLSISTNSGLNWCDMRVSSQDGNCSCGGNGNDYIGVGINKGIVYPVWTDKRVNDNHWRTYTFPYEVIQKDLTIHDITYNSSATVQSANTITAYNIIMNSGANVIFQTSQSIFLEPGFYTNDNVIFTAELFNNCSLGSSENKERQVLNEEKKSIVIKENYNSIPDKFSLSQNYPNPFNPVTLIKYALPENAHVTIKVYNVIGQVIKTLLNEYKQAGYYSVQFDAAELASGVYFYKLSATGGTGNFKDIKKMAVIK